MADHTMLKCVDCGAEFEFTGREAIFYQEKGWNPPRRCKTCRVKRKPAAPYAHTGHHDGNGNKHSEKEDGLEGSGAPQAASAKYKVYCSVCGIDTLVPFKPDPSRPAYCRSCFNKIKASKK